MKKITNQTLLTITKLRKWGNESFFIKTLVIRGIGYRAFYLINDLASNKPKTKKSVNFTKNVPIDNNLQSNKNIIENEYIYNRYLIIRAGHTLDLVQPLPANLFIKTFRKDRKLVIFGKNKNLVNSFAYTIYKYRTPSVYTGRGIRRKQIKNLRKAGKKDKQKGKSF